MQHEREENPVESRGAEGKLLGVADDPAHRSGGGRRQLSGELDEALAEVAAAHPRARRIRDRAREAAGAAADIEYVESRPDPGRLDEQRDPEGDVVVREARVEVLGRKPIRAEGDRIEHVVGLYERGEKCPSA